MSKKKIAKILIIVILIALIGVVFYFVLNKKSSQITSIPNKGQTELTQSETPKYNNTEYGFNFSLPASWAGYSIVTMNWKGNMIDVQNGGNVEGREFLIRHPLWTKDIPRQDIQIMVFTLLQWNQIKQEKLSVSAAPIGPSELGRNANYVFAIPARYNFAYPVGFEEVEKIIESKPFLAF
jgi:hypothetical protein